MAAAFFDQGSADGVGRSTITIHHHDPAVILQSLALFGGKEVQHHVFGEIGRGSEPDQPDDALGPRQCGQQHQPAAQARPHQNLRTVGEFIENGDHIQIGPVTFEVKLGAGAAPTKADKTDTLQPEGTDAPAPRSGQDSTATRPALPPDGQA